MPWPVKGGTPERTDQGVDEGVTPGATVTDPVPGTSSFVGTIPNWYAGQPLYWFKVVSGPFKGRFWYIAEQVRSSFRAGQQVSQGGAIGTVPSSGTGEESGWATSSGETQAKATTGYTEGQVTPAGQQWRSQIINAKSGATAGPTSTLAHLWIQAGGSPKLANTMAAIALAESGGIENATNQDSNGTTDYGLWQINSSHGYNSAKLLTDPMYNAQAAVAIEKSQGLTAWSTYNSGAYKQFLQGASKATVNYGGAGGSRSRPSQANQSDQNQTTIFQDYQALLATPRTAPTAQQISVGQSFKWYLGVFNDRANKVFHRG